jgi:hypothetical protein
MAITSFPSSPTESVRHFSAFGIIRTITRAMDRVATIANAGVASVYATMRWTRAAPKMWLSVRKSVGLKGPSIAFLR